MMNQSRKSKVADLNPNLLCVLCGGYYIDATTIIECLHSFCKACIVRYLETNKYCPICDVQVHKTKPLQNIRADQTLQSIVYKLVPGLFQNEMLRRQEFYAKHPDSKPTSCEDGGIVSEKSGIYAPDESICLSLEYLDSQKELSEDSFSQRFLRCPAAVTIFHLQKLIRAKYGLSSEHRVNVVYMGEALPENLTLMDVAYIYRWRRKGPLKLHYYILENRIKRRKFTHNSVFKYCNMGLSGTNSSKPFDADLVDSLQIVLSTHGLEDVNYAMSKNFDSSSKDEYRNRWKEVEIKISENGVMSVMNISMDQNYNNTTESHEKFQTTDIENIAAVGASFGSNNTATDVKPKVCEEGSVVSKSSSKLVCDDSVSKTENRANNSGENKRVDLGNETSKSNSKKPLEKNISDEHEKLVSTPIFSTSGIVDAPDKSLLISQKNTSVVCGVGSTSMTKSSNVCNSYERNATKKTPVEAHEPKFKVIKEEVGWERDTKTNVQDSKILSMSGGKELGQTKLSTCSDDGPAKTVSKLWNASKYNAGSSASKASGCAIASGSSGKVGAEKGRNNNSSHKNLILKQLAENLNSSAKPLNCNKTRNMPRYLGNPASGVKRMFQPVTVASSPNTKSNPVLTSTPSSIKPSCAITKIDPKTLCPIIDSSMLTSTNFLPSGVSSTSVIMPESHSSRCLPSTVANCKSYFQPQSSDKSSLKRQHFVSPLANIESLHKHKETPTKVHCNVSDIMAKNSTLTSSCSLLSNIPKNAHLLYVFSGSSNRLQSPSIKPPGPQVVMSGMGAFHPLPPSVNMLFNPHLQHHRFQSQCSTNHTFSPAHKVQVDNFMPKHGGIDVKVITPTSAHCIETSDIALLEKNEGPNKKCSLKGHAVGVGSVKLPSHENICDMSTNEMNSNRSVQASDNPVCSGSGRVISNCNTCSKFTNDLSNIVTLDNMSIVRNISTFPLSNNNIINNNNDTNGRNACCLKYTMSTAGSATTYPSTLNNKIIPLSTAPSVNMTKFVPDKHFSRANMPLYSSTPIFPHTSANKPIANSFRPNCVISKDMLPCGTNCITTYPLTATTPIASNPTSFSIMTAPSFTSCTAVSTSAVTTTFAAPPVAVINSPSNNPLKSTKLNTVDCNLRNTDSIENNNIMNINFNALTSSISIPSATTSLTNSTFTTTTITTTITTTTATTTTTTATTTATTTTATTTTNTNTTTTSSSSNTAPPSAGNASSVCSKGTSDITLEKDVPPSSVCTSYSSSNGASSIFCESSVATTCAQNVVKNVHLNNSSTLSNLNIYGGSTSLNVTSTTFPSIGNVPSIASSNFRGNSCLKFPTTLNNLNVDVSSLGLTKAHTNVSEVVSMVSSDKINSEHIAVTAKIDTNKMLNHSIAVPHLPSHTGLPVIESCSSVATTAVHTPICTSRPLLDSSHIYNTLISTFAMAGKSPLLKRDSVDRKLVEEELSACNLSSYSIEPKCTVHSLDCGNAHMKLSCLSGLQKLSHLGDASSKNSISECSQQTQTANVSEKALKENSAANMISKETVCVNNCRGKRDKTATQSGSVNVTVLPNPNDRLLPCDDSVSIKDQCNRNYTNLKRNENEKHSAPDERKL